MAPPVEDSMGKDLEAFIQDVEDKPQDYTDEKIMKAFQDFRVKLQDKAKEKGFPAILVQGHLRKLDEIEGALHSQLARLKAKKNEKLGIVKEKMRQYRQHLRFSLNEQSPEYKTFFAAYDWAENRTDPKGVNPDKNTEKNPIDDYPGLGEAANAHNQTRWKLAGYLAALKLHDNYSGNKPGNGEADTAYGLALKRSKHDRVNNGIDENDLLSEETYALGMGKYVKILVESGIHMNLLAPVTLGYLVGYLKLAANDQILTAEEKVLYERNLVDTLKKLQDSHQLEYDWSHDPNQLNYFKASAEYQIQLLLQEGIRSPKEWKDLEVKKMQENDRAKAKFSELKSLHEAMKTKEYVLDYKTWEGEPTLDTYFSYPVDDFDASDLETLSALEPAMKKALSTALLEKKGDDSKGLKKKLVDVSARWALLQTKDNEKGATKKAKVDGIKGEVDSAESRLNVVDPKPDSTWKALLDGADHLKGVDQTLTEQDAAITALNTELDTTGTGGAVIAPGGTLPEGGQIAPGQVVTLPPVPGTVDAPGGAPTPVPGQAPGTLPASPGGVTQVINTVNGGTPPVAPVAGTQPEGTTPAKGVDVAVGDDPFAQNWSSGKEVEPLFTQPEVKTTSELVMRNDEGKLTEVKVPADTQVFLLIGVKPKEVEGRKFVKVRHGGQSGWVEGAGLVAAKADGAADYVPPKASEDTKKTDEKKSESDSDKKEPKLSPEEKAAVELTAEQVEFQQFLRSKNFKEIFDQPSGKYFYRLGEVTKEKFFQESPVRKSGNPDVDNLYLRDVAHRLAGEGISADRLKDAERIYLQAVEASVVTFTSKPNLRELKNAYDRQFIEVWKKLKETGSVVTTATTWSGSAGGGEKKTETGKGIEKGQEKDPYASLKPFYPDYASAMEKIIRDGDNTLGVEFEIPVNGGMMKCRVQKYQNKYVFSYGEGLKLEAKFDSLKDCLRDLNSGLLKGKIMHEIFQNKTNYKKYESEVGVLDKAGLASRKNDQLYVEFDWAGWDPGIYVDVMAHGRVKWKIDYKNVGLQGEDTRSGIAEDYETFMRQMIHLKRWAEGEKHGTEKNDGWKREAAWEALSDSMNFRTLRVEKKIGMVKGFRVLPDETVQILIQRGEQNPGVVSVKVTPSGGYKLLNTGAEYSRFEDLKDGIAAVDLTKVETEKKESDTKTDSVGDVERGAVRRGAEAAVRTDKDAATAGDRPKPANDQEAEMMRRIDAFDMKGIEWKKSSRKAPEGKTRYYVDVTYEFNGVYTLPEGQKEFVLGTKEVAGVKKVQIVAQRGGDGGTKIYAIKEE